MTIRDIEVKELAWRELRPTDDDGVAQDAYTPIGHYIATETGWFLAGQTQWADAFDLEHAKAAAQADFDARIRSALVERKAEPVAWRVRVKSDDPEEWFLLPAGGGADYLGREGYECQPLYTRETRQARRYLSTPPAAAVTADELEKARAEQGRLRRDAEGSRDAAFAAYDTMRRAVSDLLNNDGGEGSQCYDARRYFEARTALSGLAKSAPPSPVDSRDALVERKAEPSCVACEDKPSAVCGASTPTAASVTVGVPQDVINLVVAAREFWDANNDLSDESQALDRALDRFSSLVSYEKRAGRE